VPKRVAAAMGLVMFAVTLLVGGIQADNPFSTAVLRALLAMAGTFVIGLVLGAMGQRMLEENLRARREKLKNNEGNVGT
jgi:NhaP-type Na+/H+ or K+/H+ antiporter